MGARQPDNTRESGDSLAHRTCCSKQAVGKNRAPACPMPALSETRVLWPFTVCPWVQTSGEAARGSLFLLREPWAVRVSARAVPPVHPVPPAPDPLLASSPQGLPLRQTISSATDLTYKHGYCLPTRRAQPQHRDPVFSDQMLLNRGVPAVLSVHPLTSSWLTSSSLCYCSCSPLDEGHCQTLVHPGDSNKSKVPWVTPGSAVTQPGHQVP